MVPLGPDDGFDWHRHDHHQLAWASRGVLVLSVGTSSYVLPRTRALWIPAGIRHAVSTQGATTMLSIYVEPGQCPLGWTEPTVVDADGLAGALGAHLTSPTLTPAARVRAESVLWDVLEPVPTTVLSTPLPTDDRARRVADGILAGVDDARSLQDWGREVGASARTLARLFDAETGLGFERWRTCARLSAALPRLAEGATIAAVARDVGYANPSAFVAAFKREIGTTPAAYFRRP